MKLHPKAREYYGLKITTDPPVDSWDASFDSGATWLPGATDEAGVTRWLVAGPTADDTTDATVLLVTTLPLIRSTSNPETIVRKAPSIYVG